MTAARVDLAGVNVMAMDFGVPAAAKDMRAAVLSSLRATHRQLGAVLGRDLSDAQRWARLGATVMIGQNDVRAERFTTADASALVRFAREHRLGRLSTWSLNRDAQCGATFPVVGTLSNLCSGVRQRPRQFGRTFARLRGSARARSAVVQPTTALATGSLEDDPERSPYMIWSPDRSYTEGWKVVWHQAVYVAKWFTQGDTPDAAGVDPGRAPWRLVGPVLSTDRKPKLERVPAGTHPEWRIGRAYRAGDKVLRHGLPYQASWFTQGDVPGAAGPNGSPSPWKPLYAVPGEPTDED
jgi:chitinase